MVVEGKFFVSMPLHLRSNKGRVDLPVCLIAKKGEGKGTGIKECFCISSKIQPGERAGADSNKHLRVS